MIRLFWFVLKGRKDEQIGLHTCDKRICDRSSSFEIIHQKAWRSYGEQDSKRLNARASGSVLIAVCNTNSIRISWMKTFPRRQPLDDTYVVGSTPTADMHILCFVFSLLQMAGIYLTNGHSGTNASKSLLNANSLSNRLSRISKYHYPKRRASEHVIHIWKKSVAKSVWHIGGVN
jgi:hypothetical protein